VSLGLIVEIHWVLFGKMRRMALAGPFFAEAYLNGRSAMMCEFAVTVIDASRTSATARVSAIDE
jgi:hypothetical protein